MAVGKPPSLVGKIKIDSTRNEVYWTEETGAIDLQVTLSDSLQYPGDLIVAIAAEMTGESLASGNALTYTGSFDIATGKVTIEATGNFRIRNNDASTLAGTIWAGGSQDSESQTFLTGDYNPGFYLGFPIAALASYSDSVTSPNSVGAFVTFNKSPSFNPGRQYEGFSVQSTPIKGAPVTYDYQGYSFDINDNFPAPTTRNRRELRFRRS